MSAREWRPSREKPGGIPEYPWLGQLGDGDIPISVSMRYLGEHVVNEQVIVANGYNTHVEFVAISGGTIRERITIWEARERTERRGIERLESRPDIIVHQGDTALGVVHRMRRTDPDPFPEEYDVVVLYECEGGKSFGDYPEVVAWIQPEVAPAIRCWRACY